MHGIQPHPKPTNRQELLDRIELSTMGAEVCHGATFLLAFLVALLLLAVGKFPEAMWIVAFNMFLNGYPVMLQRANRWRVQQVRASTRRGRPEVSKFQRIEVIVLPPNTSFERTREG